MIHWLLLAPIVLVTVGVAVIYWPAALIVAGVSLAAWILYPEGKAHGS